jgi:serine/threonine-protein kinase
LHVEAAAFQGKPVFFSLVGDWTKPDRMTDTEKKSFAEKMSTIVQIVVLIGGLCSAALLARKNYRHGRGDRQGALRLAMVMFALEIGLFLCLSHFSSIGDAIFLTIIALSTALFISGAIWMLYMAVEPWVRRQWPKTIISWTRLLSGAWRDPVLGRDVLLGVALGIVWLLVFEIRSIPMMHLGAAPDFGSTDALMGGRVALGAWLRQWPQSIQTTLIFFLLLLGLRFLLRKEWLAAIVFVAIFSVPRGLTSDYVAIELPTQILVYAIALLIVIRFGLVPLAIAIFTIDMMAGVPFSTDFSTWYMTTSVFALLSVVALAAWGFYRSLGGEPVWKVEMD